MKSNQRPKGWPWWLWILVRIFVAPECRVELEEPDKRAKLARGLADSLVCTKLEVKQWRLRALAIEQLYSQQYSNMRKAGMEHAGLSWRL